MKTMTSFPDSEDLYIEFRKTYLMFLTDILDRISKGDEKAAEQYQTLEETWKKVEQWNQKTK